MANFEYSRQIVPVAETITLETQFKDSAGNPKDADAFPTINILDASGAIVIATTATGILRTGMGMYRYDFIVPSGFVEGLWNDVWSAAVDGYTISSTFDFLVNSKGSVEAVGTIVDPGVVLGDAPEVSFTNDEIKNINVLLRILKARVQNNAFTPSGDPCNVFQDEDLVSFLCSSLAEFNSTPTITNYGFDSALLSTIFSDIISQGAYLIAMAAIATIEAGREFSLNDNGVTINPPPVSGTITSLHGALLSDYRAKLKEIKRNHRPIGLGMGAGSLLPASPAIRRLRHRRENQII